MSGARSKKLGATFFVRVKGDSMKNAGIRDGDILVVDRAMQPTHNAIVIAILNNEFTVKRLSLQGGHIFLLPANPLYEPIKISEDMPTVDLSSLAKTGHRSCT